MAIANKLEPEETAQRLEGWLSARLDDAQNVAVTGVEIPHSTGFSCETVLFDASWSDPAGSHSRRLAARLAPERPGLFPDYDLARDFAVIAALDAHSEVPAPRAFLNETDPSILGTPFLTMDRVEGRGFPDDPPYTGEGWVVELLPEGQCALYEGAIDVLVAIHAVDWRAAGLDILNERDEGATPLDRQLAYSQRYIDFAAGGEGNPLLQAAQDRLAENRPSEDSEPVLCWGDARFANLLASDDLTVSAALDWEEATIGDAALDVGYWLFGVRHHTEGLGIPLPPGFLSHEEAVALYEKRSGRSVEHWAYYEKVAALRGCCVVARMAALMIAAGFIPPDSEMPHNNSATQLLAQMFDLPAPTGDMDDWRGRR